jgi:hypothetical protein
MLATWFSDHKNRLVSRSMVDQDTDRYVLEVLSPKLRRKLEDGKEHTQWTDLL